MSSFSTILNSLQNGNSQDKSAATANVTKMSKDTTLKPFSSTTPTAGVKRKADVPIAPPAKVTKLTPPQKDVRPQHKPTKSAITTTPNQTSTVQPYRGTMQSGGLATRKDTKPAVIAKAPQPQPVAQPPAAKRGFAALMAKASAAQETIKAVGSNTIKHKPTEIIKKKDRLRLMQDAKQRERTGRHGQSRQLDAQRAVDSKSTSSTKIVPPGRRPRQEISYAGTMRGKTDAAPLEKKRKDKGAGQDKYGGYAAWSDLSDAENEDEEDEQDYESSDMEEAGFDDMMDEELQASRIARQEDERELAEEERLKREKMERKKKLMALSSSAAAAKKRF